MKLSTIRPVILTAACVWIVWMICLGPLQALGYVVHHWEVALTMLFGSFVAGSTSLGGGAVAFPVFTKVLQVSSFDANVFSLMIQSVGMGTATFFIVVRRITVEWRIVLVSTIAGAIGIYLGAAYLAPLIPSTAVKILFSMILTSFGLTLLMLNIRRENRHDTMPAWGYREVKVIFAASLAGGVISGLQGSGIDIVIFSVMVLYFRICEKVATPTSVVIMAFNAMIGAYLHNFVFNDTAASVVEYWYAAIPVVVVGAPVGAIVCSFLKREVISNSLLVLILIDLISTLLLVPMQPYIITLGLVSVVLFSGINLMMLRTRTYQRLPQEGIA
ncbi:hypothetical protein BTA51_24350 [Hahella sp. CCB-MM4]|uniref:sulfite exporter TauE/SafE family protein n=1 Tax=Hahella sp. (strain CCB-MM4) TaxID=1926491 RepID=UPI000B9C2E6D|nr:sulfite exporter TauE/SafE family protein [Hahella sp. CCB-MM4]OZG70721.1 hypothetical protein BTA51_24350 [Hahella sp. CCB-MM4]